MKAEITLETIYDKLDFSNGQLFSVSGSNISQNDWLDKGEWLKTADRAGADKIYFINNNPIVVFAKCLKTEDKIATYNKLWCLARPRILFLECQGELSVIDLAQAPIRKNERKLRTLETVKNIQKVSEKLQLYNRDSIESGKVFEDGRFGNLRNRADVALISDLKTVRQELIEAGLSNDKIKYAHALIGRSIFIRYLEDRHILTKEYFDKVALNNNKWKTILNKPSDWEPSNLSDSRAYYPRILNDKKFTYEFFKTLSEDFNGDMFPNVREEKENVEIEHLELIQGLLYGDTESQQKLFFFSYKFDIIPLDLISAIYENFYHTTTNKEKQKSKARQTGAFYTPPVLAEFLTSRVLTAEEIKKKPRILDPACGSGIFLVESFRRIVRFTMNEEKRRLDFDELKNILRNQIFGIEYNEEAARITAFSLYLAMLHYLEPTSIQEHINNHNKLPNLLNLSQNKQENVNSISVCNAFNVNSKNYGTFDIVVGNPPWGSRDNKADPEIKQMNKDMQKWCEDRSYTIGDIEASQAFLWLSLEFLKENGQSALLTSAGVLFKHGNLSKTFRDKWLNRVVLKEVFNFSHVRKFFFKSATSPFLLIHFNKSKLLDKPVVYWSAKQIITLKKTQSVIFSKYDRNLLFRQDLSDNKTWKINWFGRNGDAKFIKHLSYLDKLSEFIDHGNSGGGYKLANRKNESDWLLNFKVLPVKNLSRYETLDFFCDPPPKVEYPGKSCEIYKGLRILVKRGISQKGLPLKYQIMSRIVKEDFCYTNSINSLKLQHRSMETYLLIQGILWSSFIRYYFFLTSSNWGLWHYEIHLEELFQLPVILDVNKSEAKKVISIVSKIRDYRLSESKRSKLEKDLDEAVFDLYEFSEEQRDLIFDCCEVTIPFFYKPYISLGIESACTKDVDISWIKTYAELFSKRWLPYLEDDEVLRAIVHIGASANLLALEFYPADLSEAWKLAPKEDSWSDYLQKIGDSLPREMGTSQILLEGIVQVVTDTSIIIIKRNQKRFWTRSLAREDAESTLSIRMFNTMPVKEDTK